MSRRVNFISIENFGKRELTLTSLLQLNLLRRHDMRMKSIRYAPSEVDDEDEDDAARKKDNDYDVNADALKPYLDGRGHHYLPRAVERCQAGRLC